MHQHATPLAVTAAALLLAACGQAAVSGAGDTLSLTVAPASVSLIPHASQTFLATVSGGASTAVVWSVEEGAAGGTVTGGGAYTAPSGTGQFHVVATAVADATKRASATVTVAEVAVTISPATASLATGAARDFSCTVAGPSDTTCTWSVAESGGGTVSAAGHYVAPGAAGTFHVVARSRADPTRSAAATVTVTAPVVSVAVVPRSVSVVAGGSQTFAATVGGTGNASVSWAVQEGVAGGGISSGGVYTAPSSPGTYHVVVTSLADATKSDTATVTVVAQVAGAWLTVAGHRILKPDGQPWHGRGANIHDTRGCGACTFNAPSPAEVERRIDELVDVWHANFMRLDMESYASGVGQVNWAGILSDPTYLAHIQQIVAHAVAKPGVYVLLSLWVDPTFTDTGWPTAATNLEWARLAEVFKDEPRVLFGLVNEPQANWDGAQDAQVWAAMNSAVQTIRDVETAAGTPHHVITVQGTQAWSRVLDYYLTHPITAGGGVNIAYETHVYDAADQFAARFETPSATIPVIIGEFGPFAGVMTEAECSTLMASAEAHGVPYLAWTFHMRCPPNLLVDSSAGSCGVGMALAPTAWGTLLKNRLATPW